jgi:hypothetical protein
MEAIAKKSAEAALRAQQSERERSEAEQERSDAFIIRGKHGTLQRGKDGFYSFHHKRGTNNTRYTLNQTEARIAEKLWQAAKDGTRTVHKGTLLKVAKKKEWSESEYENVSKVFSKSGKPFYQQFVDHDNKGNYWLSLEKI